MRVEFLSPLDTRHTPGGEWQLLADFHARVTLPGGQQLDYVVPVGFLTDFASVPRLPVAYLLTADSAHEAAVLHDWLYKTQAGRSFADRVFLHAMAAMGEPGWRRWLMYAGVRLGGWVRYSKRGDEGPRIEPVPDGTTVY